MGRRLHASLDTKDEELRRKTLFSSSSGFVLYVIHLAMPGLREKLTKETIEKLSKIHDFDEPLKKHTQQLWEPDEVERMFAPIKGALDEIMANSPNFEKEFPWCKVYVQEILELAKCARKNNLKIDMSIG